MKVIFASLSAVLLSSIPGVLSAEPNLRGGGAATLVADFEDHATELIDSMPSSIKKKLKSIKKDDDLTKEEIKSAQKKVIRKWKRYTKKNCVEYNSPATCRAAKKCVWTKDTCVSTKALYADYFFDSSEDYVADEDYDFMANYPKKVEKELKSIKKDSDLTKKEVKSEQKSVIKSWEKRTEKYCVEYLSMTACDAVSKCEWNREDGCVSSKAFAEDYGYDFMTKSYNVPKKVEKKLKEIKKDNDLTKKEIKSEQKKIIRKWERKTEKKCIEYRSPVTCGAVRKCVWHKDGCVSKSIFEEDYGYDFMTKSYNVPKKVEKKLKEIKKDSDLTKKEIKSEQKKIIRKWERKTEKKCIEYRSPVTCGAASKCVWHKDGCVSKSVFGEDLYFGSEDYGFIEESEDYDGDSEDYDGDSEDYDGDSEVYYGDSEDYDGDSEDIGYY